jgi:predicted 3-demethylubiquinone-9 3-methyltransferase (glyoxalase superfamily)
MQKISPCLWFDDQAEEAVDFYASVFANSKITSVSRYGKESAQVAGKPERSVMVMEFELEGQRFMALNGGPQFTFTPAISLMVNCETQAEVDELWDRLSEGGSELQCGWLTDRYGVSWQIVPARLGELMGGDDSEKSRNVMQALLQMRKIDLTELQRAYDEA